MPGTKVAGSVKRLGHAPIPPRLKVVVSSPFFFPLSEGVGFSEFCLDAEAIETCE